MNSRYHCRPIEMKFYLNDYFDADCYARATSDFNANGNFNGNLNKGNENGNLNGNNNSGGNFNSSIDGNSNDATASSDPEFN